MYIVPEVRKTKKLLHLALNTKVATIVKFSKNEISFINSVISALNNLHIKWLLISEKIFNTNIYNVYIYTR